MVIFIFTITAILTAFAGEGIRIALMRLLL